MKTRSSSHAVFPRAGFTLTEVLMTLGLLVIVMGLGGQILRAVVLSSADSQRIENQTSALDAAALQLRKDVWHATAIATPDLSSAVLQTPDGAVRWTIQDQRLQRESGSLQTRWKLNAAGFSFSARSCALILRDDALHEIVAPSQLLLARTRP